MSTTTIHKGTPMTSEKISTLVQRYFAATRAMDVNAWLACFADNAISHDPYGGRPVQGKEELRNFFLSVATAFKEIGFTEDFVTVAGNRAALKFTARGTGKNGKPAIGEGIDIFEINDRGTIQTMWGYWDPAAMMAQLQE
jgi:steroid Delta-isomerase